MNDDSLFVKHDVEHIVSLEVEVAMVEAGGPKSNPTTRQYLVPIMEKANRAHSRCAALA